MTIRTPARNLIAGVSALAFLAFLALPQLVAAASQSYDVANSAVQSGMLVSLTKNSGVVEPANDKNVTLLIGVDTSTDTAFDQQAGQVSVAVDGSTSTLVSTLNGDIKVGDRVGPSSLSGIGAKASDSGWIVGAAQANFDSTTTGAVKSTVRDSKGGMHTVYIGRIPMIVHVTYYNAPNDTVSRIIPTTVQNLADTFAGKHASLLGVVLSFILLLVGIAVVGFMINSTIRGGFLAISRQPLAKAIIWRKIMQSFGVSALILLAVFAAAAIVIRVL